eukprot:11317180-Ditylum_brightwellii.AAC.1
MGAAGLKGWAILLSDSVIIAEFICPPGTGVGVNNTGPAALGGRVVGQMRVGWVGLGQDGRVGRRYDQLLVGSALVLRLMQDVRAFHLPGCCAMMLHSLVVFCGHGGLPRR